MNHRQYEFACAKEWERTHPEDKVSVTPKGKFGADGGIDLVIKTPNGEKLGQCKHYFKNYNGPNKRKAITSEMIKAFRWDMEKRKRKDGVYFSSIMFSTPAAKEAKEDGIEYVKFSPDEELKR